MSLLKRAQRTKVENGLRLDEGKVSFKGIQKLPEQGSAGKACSGRFLGQRAKVFSPCPALQDHRDRDLRIKSKVQEPRGIV